MWLGLLFSCDPDAGGAVDWAIEPTEVGAPQVEGESFDPADGATLGAAFPQLMPGWDDTFPAFDVPSAIWTIALHELVADEGVCPYEELDGTARTFRTDCRSKDGYEWEGDVVVDAWDEGDVSFERYDFDVQVTGDVDSPRFEHLALAGSLQRATSSAITHVDVNVAAELLGYFEARQLPDDPRVAAWADWRASGSLELEGAELRVDAHANIGGSGAFPLLAPDLGAGSDCPVEPAGDATMGDGVTVRFDGADACDACAAIVTESGETAACAP